MISDIAEKVNQILRHNSLRLRQRGIGDTTEYPPEVHRARVVLRYFKGLCPTSRLKM